MARKNLLSGLTEPKLTAVNSEAPPEGRSTPLAFSGKGALGAVTRSIDDLAAKANAARDLEARLTSGQVIVEIDPALIDTSFILDRMSGDDDDYLALKDSIAQSGQGSPILVRPHPIEQGRYQVAFGHRRLRASRDLARPVRAVVRVLSDRELVLAQGQENSARSNLSFIERARFAHNLEQGGYDRETIMLALTIDKTTLSRLISVVARTPPQVIDAIGPAATTGRDRWVELASLFHEKRQPAGLVDLLGSDDFLARNSDERFQSVMASFTPVQAVRHPTEPSPAQPAPSRGEADYWTHSDGTKVMKVSWVGRSVLLTIDKRAVPGFAEFLLSEMEGIFTTFRERTVAKKSS